MIGDPLRAAQAAARAARPRRFYRTVSVEPRAAGHVVLLDGREVRTPARHALALPSPALAEAVAEEWRAQEAVIDAVRMPVTRLANSAIDGVASAMDDVRADISRFAEADLVCYRAAEPEGLVAAQCAHWDPVIDWARGRLGVRVVLAEGVMHVAQPPEARERIDAALAARGPLELAAVHVMTTLTGSCLIALAVADGRLSAEAAWAAAHVDEDWQISQWGEDAEATARRASRWHDMEAAARVAALLRG